MVPVVDLSADSAKKGFLVGTSGFRLFLSGNLQGCVRYGTYRGVPPVLPVPGTSVSSVRHQYRYRTLRYVRYNINTGTGHLGMFGTTSIPVPVS